MTSISAQANILASDAIVKLNTPTVKEGTGWRIITSPLGCGSRILQGWSEGIGIRNTKDTFEKDLFTLMYLSLHPEYTDNKWTQHSLGRSVAAPIMVNEYYSQYLVKGTTYIMSSLTPWIERFAEFVKKHHLGDISVGHEWINPYYKGAANKYASWTWNGNIPKAADVGFTDWSLPE